MKLTIFPIVSVFVAVIALGQDTATHQAGDTATSVTKPKCALSTASNGQTLKVKGKG